MSDDVRVNGNVPDWASIVLRIADERYHGFTSINFGDSLEREASYGMGRDHAPRGTTSGKYVTDPVTLTGEHATINAVAEALANLGDGVSYGSVEFQIVVQVVEDAISSTTQIDGCKFSKRGSAYEEGPGPLREDIEITCTRIQRDGLTLYRQVQ